MKAIVFDFDGVLINSLGFHTQKFQAFANVPVSSDDLREMSYGNVHQSKPQKFQHVDWSTYNDFIHADYITMEIHTEIKQTVERLAPDYSLHIITSAGENIIRDSLEKNRFCLFQDVLGKETHKSKVEKFRLLFRKHSLSPDDCLFVTDTLGDILEANEVGVKTVAVDFGYHDRETLRRGNPYAIVSHLNELFGVLETV